MKVINAAIVTVAIGFIVLTTIMATTSHGNEVSASFDRDLHRTYDAGKTSSLSREIHLPTRDAINHVLWTRSEDAVSASFERELNHAPTIEKNSRRPGS